MKELLIFDDLRTEGREEGRKEGFKEGHIEGQRAGLELGRLQTLTELVHNGLLSATDAAASMGIPLEEFQKRMEHHTIG